MANKLERPIHQLSSTYCLCSLLAAVNKPTDAHTQIDEQPPTYQN